MTDSIQHLIEPHIQDLGGFQVRRLLPSDVLTVVGPFIFFDHLGPAVFAPGQGVDVRPHPHINLATVTYLFEGVLLLRPVPTTIIFTGGATISLYLDEVAAPDIQPKDDVDCVVEIISRAEYYRL
jgi:hypothetical protein